MRPPSPIDMPIIPFSFSTASDVDIVSMITVVGCCIIELTLVLLQHRIPVERLPVKLAQEFNVSGGILFVLLTQTPSVQAENVHCVPQQNA